MFQETARIISQVTKNVSLVLAPQMTQAAFRCLQFLPLDDRRVITVLMTDAGFIENKILDVKNQLVANYPSLDGLLTDYMRSVLPEQELKKVDENLRAMNITPTKSR